MLNEKIGIITNSKNGILFAESFRQKGYRTLVCISDDCLKIGPEKRKYLADICDSFGLNFVFDRESFLEVFEKDNSVLFFFKVTGDYSTEYIESFGSKMDDTVVADCCTYDYARSAERDDYFSSKQIMYISAPVICSDSVNETGASFFPCGNKEIYEIISPVLKNVCAYYDKTPCCDFCGKPGTGCFISSLHNVVYRSLVETTGNGFSVIKDLLKYDNEAIHDILLEWNETNIKSGILLLVADILSRKDVSGQKYLLDEVNTYFTDFLNPELGKTVKDSVLFTPNLSLGINSDKIFSNNTVGEEIKKSIAVSEMTDDAKASIKDKTKQSCLLSYIAIYDQAFSVLDDFAKKNKEKINFSSVAKNFYGGNIINSTTLMEIIGLFDSGVKPEGILSSVNIRRNLIKCHNSLRSVVCFEISNGFFHTSFLNTLMYFDSFSYVKNEEALLKLTNDCIYDSGFEVMDSDKLQSADWGSISKNTNISDKPL